MVGAFLTLITNITSIFDKTQNGNRARKLNDSLLLMNTRLIQSQDQNLNLLLEQQVLSKKIASSQDDILDINNELTNANKKIISLQDKVIDNVIGAGNLPNLIISGSYVDKFYYTLQFGIINKGRTPLRGLSAEITDIYSNTYYN